MTMDFELGDLKIPTGMITAFSYTLKSRLGERHDGRVFSCGFEAPEVSLRVIVSPSVCSLFGVDYRNALTGFLGLDISRKTTPKQIKIGDFVPCRGFLFAPTSINFSTDAEGLEYEFDVVLSPVQNALLAESNRASASKNQLLPRVVLTCDGKSIELKDEITFTELMEMPDGCYLTALIGDDSRLAEFESWAGRLSKGGEIQIETSETRKYYCTTADLLDGELTITGSIYPPSAFVPVTVTYRNTDLGAILKDIAGMFGFAANVRVSGNVSYFLLEGTPLEAIANLQNSAGFLVSATPGNISFVRIPDGEQPLDFVTLTAIPVDDTKAEKCSGCRWIDGEHEFVYENGDGPKVECRSCFCSDDSRFATERTRLENYRNRMFKADLPLDLRVVMHSPVSVETRSELRSGLIEYFIKDYIENTLELHINTLEDL